jgi:hypothetical protein
MDLDGEPDGASTSVILLMGSSNMRLPWWEYSSIVVFSEVKSLGSMTTIWQHDEYGLKT